MLKDFGTILIIVFIFWPWGIGIVDLNYWMIFGEQLTNLPWNSYRGFAMLIWPIWTGIIVAKLSSL